MKTAFVVGGAGAVAVVALAYSMPRLSHCPYTDDGCFDRTKERQTPYWWGIGISTAVAAIGAFVGTVYWRHPHPISESYAEKLAADYNEGLRESLGLVSLDVSPYVSKDGGGLAVAGSF